MLCHPELSVGVLCLGQGVCAGSMPGCVASECVEDVGLCTTDTPTCMGDYLVHGCMLGQPEAHDCRAGGAAGCSQELRACVGVPEGEFCNADRRCADGLSCADGTCRTAVSCSEAVDCAIGAASRCRPVMVGATVVLYDTLRECAATEGCDSVEACGVSCPLELSACMVDRGR